MTRDEKIQKAEDWMQNNLPKVMGHLSAAPINKKRERIARAKMAKNLIFTLRGCDK